MVGKLFRAALLITASIIVLVQITMLVFPAVTVREDKDAAGELRFEICEGHPQNHANGLTAAVLEHLRNTGWENLPISQTPSSELVKFAQADAPDPYQYLSWLSSARNNLAAGDTMRAAESLISGMSRDRTLLVIVVEELKEITLQLIPRLLEDGHTDLTRELIAMTAIASADPVAFLHTFLGRLSAEDIGRIWQGDPYIVLVDFNREDALTGMYIPVDFQGRTAMNWKVEPQPENDTQGSVVVSAGDSTRKGDLHVVWGEPFMQISGGKSGLRVYARPESPTPLGVIVHAAGQFANKQPFHAVLSLSAPQPDENGWLLFDTHSAGPDLFGSLINAYGQARPWSIWNMDLQTLEDAEMRLTGIGLDIPTGPANRFWLDRIELYIPQGSWNEPYRMPEPSGFGRGLRRLDPVRATAATLPQDLEQLAELESLGYLGAITSAPEMSGVTVHDRSKAWPGLNFHPSGSVPEIHLTDMDGQSLHVWHPRFEDPLWPRETAEIMKTRGWRRAYLYPNGDVLAVNCGIVLAKMDKDGNPIWVLPGGYHHDFKVMEDGTIYTLYREWEDLPNAGLGNRTLVDYILLLDPDGRELRRVSVLKALEDSFYAPMLHGLQYDGDILHTNSIQVLDGQLSDKLPAFKKGNVLLCMLTASLIAVVDMDTERIVWGQSGMWLFPHDPRLLPDDTMLIFDNSGPAWHDMTYRASRVMEFDPLTREVLWEYSGSRTEPFYSNIMGAACLLPNDNILISETTGGRAFEINRDKQIVWEYFNPVRGGANNELIAVIPELIRYPETYADAWLGR